MNNKVLERSKQKVSNFIHYNETETAFNSVRILRAWFRCLKVHLYEPSCFSQRNRNKKESGIART